MRKFSNCYQDGKRAEAYSKLEFAGTYYLAYRDLPQILRQHVAGDLAIDFGCGAGRSTRFLRRHGFKATGVDISEDMVKKARHNDPEGDYRLIQDGDFSQFEQGKFDLVLSAFTFDNIPTMEWKVSLFGKLKGLLNSEGKIIHLVSAPEIYVHEWASFSTKDFPENRYAKSGDIVKIIVTDLEDRRPVEDVFWTDESYRQVFHRAGLECMKTYRPLGEEAEPYRWISETQIAPWVIYVLNAQPGS